VSVCLKHDDLAYAPAYIRCDSGFLDADRTADYTYNGSRSKRQMRRKTGIRRAIQIAGTQTHLAELCGVAQARVAVWLQQGYVPAPRAPIVAEMTGVPLVELLKPPKPARKRNATRIKSLV